MLGYHRIALAFHLPKPKRRPAKDRERWDEIILHLGLATQTRSVPTYPLRPRLPYNTSLRRWKTVSPSATDVSIHKSLVASTPDMGLAIRCRWFGRPASGTPVHILASICALDCLSMSSNYLTAPCSMTPHNYRALVPLPSNARHGKDRLRALPFRSLAPSRGRVS